MSQLYNADKRNESPRLFLLFVLEFPLFSKEGGSKKYWIPAFAEMTQSKENIRCPYSSAGRAAAF